jgi:hypothetical protein
MVSSLRHGETIQIRSCIHDHIHPCTEEEDKENLLARRVLLRDTKYLIWRLIVRSRRLQR